jgi:hypothetical protein|tara:strand:- start:1266 stop:1916 length:651 start_codon:yes stop_codon:yes gene_type:complete
MSNYGYTGNKPTQSKSGNTGVFTPADLKQLDTDNKIVNSLYEHIVTLEVGASSISSIEITKSAYPELWKYSRIAFWLTDVSFDASNYLRFQVSSDNGSTFDSGTSDYRHYYQVTRSSGSQNQYYDDTEIGGGLDLAGSGTNKSFNSHGYITGLLSKRYYANCVFVSQGEYSDGQMTSVWGIGKRNTYGIYDGFRFVTNNGLSQWNAGKLHLYGVPV